MKEQIEDAMRRMLILLPPEEYGESPEADIIYSTLELLLKYVTWINVEDRLPDGHSELRQNEIQVLGYNEEWIHPDFNPLGIRMCAYCKDWDDNQWRSPMWIDSQDSYITDNLSSPTKWRPLPSQ